MTRRNTVVTASAGTGKTYRLVSEFASAVLGNEGESAIPAKKMLALTFTEKAAAEMRTRISERLAGAVRDLSLSSITTYHSFCAGILREYGEKLDVDPGFQLLDPFEENELASKVAKLVVIKQLEKEDAALLSLVARLELSGVIESLTSTRERMIESGVEPSLLPASQSCSPDSLLRSLELRDNVKRCRAAFEAYAEVSLSSEALQKIQKARATFSMLEQVLDDFDLTVIEVQLSSLFSTLRAGLGGRFGPDALRKNLLGEMWSLGALLCASFVYPEETAFRKLLESFWDELEVAKRKARCLAFGDLLLLVRRLLRKDVEVRKQLKARFERVLVDEYQDTSPIQEDIVALLCEGQGEEQELAPGEPALLKVKLSEGKLFVVGDPKQSIYGFRGSDVTLFKRMADVIVGQGGQHDSLNVSRRSSASVVRVVNAAVPCDESEKLVPLRDGEDEVGALLKGSDEPELIAAEIYTLLKTCSCVPSDIAILVRRIKKASPIVQALLKLGIPARIWGGEGFFSRQEVVELICALKLSVDPNDKIALLTVLRSPLVRFDDFYWPRLFKSVQDSGLDFTVAGLLQAVDEGIFDDALTRRIRVFFDAYAWIQSGIASITANEALEKLLSANDYVASLASDAYANVHKLRGMLIEVEGDFRTQVDYMVRKKHHMPKEALGEERMQPNCVRVMTIHQSKGLEFPVVILADTSATIPSDSSDLLFDDKLGLAITHRGRPIATCAPEGEWADRFPTPIQAMRTRSREQSEAELLRLLYVGLTRARDRIYVVDSREVDEKGKSVHRGTTLLSLFLEHAADALQTRIHAREILAPLVQEQEVVTAPAFLESLPRRKLLFASDLNSPIKRSEIRAERIGYRPNHALLREMSPSERGSLAHKLMRMATEQLTLKEFEDQRIVKKVLDAAARVLGARPDENLIDDCMTTIEAVIWPLLQSEFEFSFEVPILYEDENWVVTGFADAVAKRGDIVCVIDFKSSQHAAQSERTKLQLLAYCAALKDPTQRIFYSSCVIGDRESLHFEAYEEQAEQKLRDHLSEARPRESAPRLSCL